MEYKVTEKDLIGDIECFPIEVVRKMIERCEDCGETDGIVKLQDSRRDGFVWQKSLEGQEFWEEVIKEENFDLFFEKYPKPNKIKIEKDMETKKLILNGITLPTDTEVKVSVEDGATIITFQKQESDEQKFKNGDILLLTNNDGFEYIAIFKEMDNAIIYVYTSINITNNRIGENNGFFRDKMSNVRKADHDEQEKMFKELANQKHLRWNAEELKFEEYRWRAEKGGKYWYIGDDGEIHESTDIRSCFDKRRYNFCNYFQTKELIKQSFPKLKEFFKNLSL